MTDTIIGIALLVVACLSLGGLITGWWYGVWER